MSKITATNQDNMLMMARYPDNHFDLALVDPPYGIDAGKMTMGSGKHIFKKGKDWDSSVPDSNYFKELFRVSKNQIIWGGNYFILPVNNNWIIWDKLNPNLSFSEGEMAWCSIKKNVRIFKRLSTLPDYDGKKRHPTQKPIKLYEYCLLNYAKEGDKIVDTHRGSASLDIACHNLGFDLVTCEIDKDYFNDGNKRLKQHQNQLKMF
jgi:site-specific DNA-methyltransferase (adenine-specific)